MTSSSLGGDSGFTRPTGIGVRFRMASWIVPGVLAGEGLPACRHLVEDGAEREEVGAGVERFAANLFGRHVRQRAQHRARDRSSAPGSVLPSSPADPAAAWPARNRAAWPDRVGDEDVGRLDVAVDDPLGVGGFERIGELHAKFEDSIRGQRAAGDELVQRACPPATPSP